LRAACLPAFFFFLQRWPACLPAFLNEGWCRLPACLPSSSSSYSALFAKVGGGAARHS
jgi:hypothetical protein